MRVVCTSDLHGTTPVDLPEGDVLVIAGDVCPVWDHDRAYQANWLKGHFREWLLDQPHSYKIVVGGNHDFVLQSTPKGVVQGWFDGAFYLQDDAVNIMGTLFYGTPWSTKFGKWAFMEEDDDLEIIYSVIPEETDVLISHGPPGGACDYTLTGHVTGSWSLRDRIQEVKPELVVCGHIHEAYGVEYIDSIPVWNVAFMNVDYKPTNEPMVIDL